MWVQKLGGGGVIGLAYSPDGGTLYTTDGGGWLTAWDVAARAGKRLFRVRPNERYYARAILMCGGRYAVIPVPGTARVWDTAAGELLPDPPPGLYAKTLCPAAARPAVYYLNADRTAIDAYDVTTGVAARLFPAPVPSGVLFADVSPDGTAAVLLTADRQSLLARADGTVTPLARPFDAAGRFSPDGRLLLWMTFNRLQAWDAATLAVRGDAACHSPYTLCAFSPTAPVFAALNPARQLTLFGLDTGAPLRSLDFALGRHVQCAAFSPDGLTCAVGGSNKQFAVFDVDV
jgi:WD40 repeat protein